MRAILGAALVTALCQPALAEPGFVPVDVTIYTIDEFVIAESSDTFGEIAFRGGFALGSRYQHFGAFSGLDIAADGSFVAITDTGFWLTGNLIEDGGWLRGVENLAMAPILNRDGEEANQKNSADAEGVRLGPGEGEVLVSFEQDHRVSRFDLADLGAARPEPVALPRLDGLRHNRGLESVAISPADGPLGDAIVVISETADDDAAGIPGWIVGGPQEGAFSVRRRGLFNITDAAFSANGDLFMLERQFSLSDGIAMRVRMVPGGDIIPGALVDGQVILFDDHLFQIDNMEGLAIRDLPSGEIQITLISDDNHSLLQRNLLLQFVWREETIADP